MATFACAVLFVVFAFATTEHLMTEHDSLFTTSDPLDYLDYEEYQEKSLGQTSHKINRPKVSSSRNKSKPGGESGVNNPYFKLLLEKEESRRKANKNVKNVNDFWEQRNAVADSEVGLLLGHLMPLDEKEIVANQIILAKKYQEYEKEVFPPSIHFYDARSLIEKSDIFKIIRKLPKGANLYALLIASAGSEFMFQLTFENNLYFRFENGLKLRFSKEKPALGWRLLSFLRSSDNPEYVEDLNNAIRENLMITTTVNANKNSTSNLLNVYSSLTAYRPNFIKTFKRVLEVFYADNIMYAEFTYHFPDLYDLDGKTYKPAAILQLCKALVVDFKKTHKDFIGVRFIYAPLPNAQQSDFRKTMIALWESTSDLMAGFGLTLGSEKKPLSDFVEELLKFPKEIKFFFSVGYTNRWGFNSDYNLLDALTLEPVRIAHAFALNKHPVVLEKLREKRIAVAINPIADQVLNNVKDIRNYPLAFLVATDFPLVIGSGAGSFFNTTGLSYNWYEVFLGMTPKFCDLRCLKQLSVNSWLYSSSSIAEKRRSILAWEVLWNKFIDSIIESYKN